MRRVNFFSWRKGKGPPPGCVKTAWAAGLVCPLCHSFLQWQTRTGIALAHPQEHHRLRQRSPQRGFQGGRAVILLRGFTCIPFHWTEPASLLYYSRKISKIQYKKFFIFGKIVLKKYYSCVIVIVNRNSGLSGRIYMPQFWNGGEAHGFGSFFTAICKGKDGFTCKKGKGSSAPALPWP